MLAEFLLSHNLVPDVLIRKSIRKRLAQKLIIEQRLQRKNDFIEELKQSPIAINTADANEQHYEVPEAFYKMCLGSHLKYSCGYWPEGVETLDDSEVAMLELYCERAQLYDGMEMLDLGCGWGSLSLFLAEKYPDAKITSVSNSTTQKAYIDEQCRIKGLSNVQVITADMNEFSIEAKFDRICSIEMFEHMRNYQKLFEKVSGWLKDDGLLFIHIFTHKELAYPYEAANEKEWMARYFFTGGIMPSEDLFESFQDHVQLGKRWVVNGRHYQKTCEAWLQAMDKHKESIVPLFSETYGKDQKIKWWVYWRVFFMSCAELFGYNNGDEWYVTHYLFTKQNNDQS